MHTIIDTAMDPQQSTTMPGTTFHQDAYDRMSQALTTATAIAITHEHIDHLGGLTQQPNIQALLPALKLTKEQLEDPTRHDSPTFPPGALENYQPLDYQTATAIAPGVVLIKAPGHTIGSQIVYIKMANGQERLLLGDVAWVIKNVTQMK